ncbi:MAG: VanZ family protein, partial [Faecousia sp.]
MLFSFIDLMCGAVFALPLAWLFMAYCKNGSKKRFLLISLFTLYLCKMFDVVGIPAVQYIRWDPAVNLIPFGDEKNLRFFLQIGLNAVMFMPLGFLLPILWSKCRHWYRTTLVGFFTSLIIEAVQMFCSRATDVDDLIMNTLG